MIDEKLTIEYYDLDKIAYEFTEKEALRGATPATPIRTKDEISIADNKAVPSETKLATIRHLLRYKFISLLAYNKVVLDFGCASGYGTLLLARNAETVMGLDAELPLIMFAQKHNNASNIYYQKLHLKNYSPKKVFDLTVAVEVFEHIHPKKLDEFVGKMRDSTKDDGLLVFTTPRMEYTVRHKESPEFKKYHSHYAEYSKRDFVQVLEENGLIVEQYVLQKWDGSIVYQPPKDADFSIPFYNVTMRKDHWVQIVVCRKL